eukprot:8349172-Ditylum_brightwellii.AAC.1
MDIQPDAPPQLTAVLQGMVSKSFACSSSQHPAKIIKRFLPQLHPDKYTGADFRIQYVLVALTALLTHSQGIIQGEQPLSDLRLLSQAFITPF